MVIMLAADRLFFYFFSKTIFSKTLSGESGGSVNYLIQKKKNIDFIILGSSRAKHHINPALLTNVYAGNGYNAGINGKGGLMYNSMLLELLVAKRIIPKLVILQFDPYPYLLAKDENTDREVSQLYPFIDEAATLKASIKKNTGFTEKAKLFLHCYRFNGKLLNILFNYTKRNTTAANNGFEGLSGKLDSSSFAITNNLIAKYDYSPVKLNSLVDIIKTCRTNNTRLVMIFPPYYRNSALYEQQNHMISTLIQKHAAVKILDFSALERYPSLQPAAMWKDEGHLNNEGAAVFSRMINDSLANF